MTDNSVNLPFAANRHTLLLAMDVCGQDFANSSDDVRTPVMDIDQTVSLDSAAPSVVKSIKQRDLLNTWLRASKACGGLPRIGDYQPERLEEEMPDIVGYGVEGEPGLERFMIDSKGSRFADAYGKTGTGHELASYLGAKLAATVIPIYRQCVHRRLPVYTIAQVVDSNGVLVDYERLLLPFSQGDRVDRILASLKTISEDGAFNLRNLMRGTGKMPVYKLGAIIDRELAHDRTGHAHGTDAIEFV